MPVSILNNLLTSWLFAVLVFSFSMPAASQIADTHNALIIQALEVEQIEHDGDEFESGIIQSLGYSNLYQLKACKNRYCSCSLSPRYSKKQSTGPPGV